MTGQSLNAFPGTASFGNVVVGASAQITVKLNNTGTLSTTYSFSYSGSSEFTYTVSGSAVVPGSSATITFTFNPTAVANYSGTLKITGTFQQSPISISITGSGVANTGSTYTVSPASLAFGTQKIGSATAQQLLTVTNTSPTANIVVSAPTFTAPFQAGSTVPSWPVTLTPGQTVQFGVEFNPTVQGYSDLTDGVVVNTNAAQATTNVECTGTGVLVTSAYTLQGTSYAVLAALNGGATQYLYQFDPTDQDCEEDAYLVKTVDFDLPGIEKWFNRMLLRYEPLEAGSITVQLAVASPRTSTNFPATNFSATGLTVDGLIHTLFCDMQQGVSAELPELTLTRPANTGPLSLAELIFLFEERGEIIENT